MSYMPVQQLLSRSKIENGADEASSDDHIEGDRPTNKKTFDIIFRMFSTCVSCLLCILLAVNLVILYKDSAASPRNHAIQKTYGRDHKYMTLDPKTDYLWDDMLSGSYPAVRFPHNGPEKEGPAAIGMFHQLHCLATLREALQQSQKGVDIGIDLESDKHWPHCLFYLRQAIFCAADSTIERQSYKDGKPAFAHMNGTRFGIIDGADDVRTCRSSEHLFSLRDMYGKKPKHQIESL